MKWSPPPHCELSSLLRLRADGVKGHPVDVRVVFTGAHVTKHFLILPTSQGQGGTGMPSVSP